MVGTFPLNVQAGSPQYTLASQITPSSSTSLITITNTDSIDPINNAYYTIQNEDGSKWCTFYVGQWTTVSSNNYTGSCTYSSSNTSDVFPEGSVCWCVWTKEYYESITTSISTVNTEISTVNNEIDTLTPKVDDSFVNAEKVGDTTLRFTKNDGTTVDISFPKGLTVRNENLTYYKNITAKSNELVVISGSFNSGSINNSSLNILGYGYISLSYNVSGNSTKTTISDSTDGMYFTNLTGSVSISGLLYDGGKLMRV